LPEELCQLIVIVDYGMGNLRSVLFKLQKYKIEAVISSEPEDILKAGKIILPGVGHFSAAMKNLKERGLQDALNESVLKNKIPVMGICLGVQLFTRYSEEGGVPGLGWINACVRHFNFEDEAGKLPVPNVGWLKADPVRKCPFWPEKLRGGRFYFTHSYYVSCENEEDILAFSTYGNKFVSAVWKDNIFGTQFHPEKSHRDGFELVKSFAEADLKC
jgi:glutamine amidotransferase